MILLFMFCGVNVTTGGQKIQTENITEKLKRTLKSESGLCSKGTQVPQATNFCLWVTR